MARPQVADGGTACNMEGSYGYIEKAVADSRQWVVFKLEAWARCSQLHTVKTGFVTKYVKQTQFLACVQSSFHIIPSIPVVSLTPFRPLNTKWSLPSTFSVFLSIPPSKCPLSCICCMCQWVDCTMVAVFVTFGCFFQAIQGVPGGMCQTSGECSLG